MILTLKFSKTNPQVTYVHYTAVCSGLKQELNQILKQCRGQSSFLRLHTTSQLLISQGGQKCLKSYQVQCIAYILMSVRL